MATSVSGTGLLNFSRSEASFESVDFIICNVTSVGTPSFKSVPGVLPGTDLKEGVPTLVTLQIMKSTDPKDAALREKLSKPVLETDVATVIAELRGHQALADAKNYLHNLAREAKEILQPLPANSAKAALESLCDAIVDRTV